MSNVTTVQECMYDSQTRQPGTTANCTYEGDIYNADSGQCPVKTNYRTVIQNSCSRREWRSVLSVNTGYTQKNGAVSKVNSKCISHLTLAQRTPSGAATVQVSLALPVVRFSCLLRGRGASF